MLQGKHVTISFNANFYILSVFFLFSPYMFFFILHLFIMFISPEIDCCNMAIVFCLVGCHGGFQKHSAVAKWKNVDSRDLDLVIKNLGPFFKKDRDVSLLSCLTHKDKLDCYHLSLMNCSMSGVSSN